MSGLGAKVAALFGSVDLHEKYQAVFSTPDGQEVLEDILRQGHVYKSVATTDSHELAIREGERRLALAIARHVYRDHRELQRRVNKQIEKLHENTA